MEPRSFDRGKPNGKREVRGWDQLQWSRDRLIAERALGGRRVIIAGRETNCER